MDREPSTGYPAHGRTTANPHRGGLVTLLFTDIVGSTALKEQLGDHAGFNLVQQHHELVRSSLALFRGAEEISVAGDSFLILFATPSDAVKFAVVLQQRLRRFNESRQVPVQDRIGLHMGEVVIEEIRGRHDVHGIQVDTCARVMSLAQADQILMTRPVFDNARQSLKGKEIEDTGALKWLNHGRYDLKGVAEPLEICEVRSSGAAKVSAPTTSEKAHRAETVEGETVVGWRPAVGQIVPNTKWVLEQKLGEGGFGEVWLGTHQVMKEHRVFKFCFRADRVRSLKREMTLFRLIKERIGDHPNIVSLREVYFDQPPYYVEEDYMPGQELRSWCESHGGGDKVPLDTKLEIVAQVADALQVAHDAGVIHRDVKPGNILVGSPKSEDRRPPKSERPQFDSRPSTLAPSEFEVQGSESQVQGSPTPPTSSIPQPPSSTSATLSPVDTCPSPLVKLTDFGIGQVISQEYLADVTRAGFTQTVLASSSSHTGPSCIWPPSCWPGSPRRPVQISTRWGWCFINCWSGIFRTL
jgi:class 3 adenylate cyclase